MVRHSPFDWSLVVTRKDRLSGILRSTYSMLVVIFVSCIPDSLAEENVITQTMEVYEYEAFPKIRKDPKDTESSVMTFLVTNENWAGSNRAISADFIEDISVTTNLEGRFVDAVKIRKKKITGAVVNKSRIWLEDDEVHIKTHGNRIRTNRIPENMRTAVDISLLYLMRSFPFETDVIWQVFMADFSGRFITVSVMSKGKERVNVPAGQLQCYRMEVTVRKAFFVATINYWLSTTKPHFLVKHEGRKGPFTRTYTTVLVRSSGVTTNRAAEQSHSGDAPRIVPKE